MKPYDLAKLLHQAFRAQHEPMPGKLKCGPYSQQSDEQKATYMRTATWILARYEIAKKEEK